MRKNSRLLLVVCGLLFVSPLRGQDSATVSAFWTVDAETVESEWRSSLPYLVQGKTLGTFVSFHVIRFAVDSSASFCVSAVDSAGNPSGETCTSYVVPGTQSDIAPDTTPPGDPTDLRVTVDTLPTALRLEGEAPLILASAACTPTIFRFVDRTSTEDFFIIDRARGSGWATLDTLQSQPGVGDTITYTDDTGQEGDSLRVFAVLRSPADSLQTGETVVLCRPTNLAVTIQATDSADLSWNDNSGLEAGYEIRRCQGDTITCTDDLFAIIDSVGADVTTYADASLTADVTYTWDVGVFGAAGVAARTAKVSGTTPTATTVVLASTATASDTGAADILKLEHIPPVVADTPRYMLNGISLEAQGTPPDLAITSVTFGNQACTLFSAASVDVTDASDFGNRQAVYYCDEDAIAAATDDTLRVDPSDATADLGVASRFYVRAARGAPQVGTADTAVSSDVITSSLTPISDSTLIVQFLTISDSLASSALAPSIDRYEVRLSGEGSTRMAFAGADRGPITPVSSQDLTYAIVEPVGRLAHTAVALRPASQAEPGTGTMTIATTGFVNDSLAAAQAAGNPLPAFWGADGAGARALWGGSEARCDTLAAEVLSVTNTNNTGAGSLRQALTDASNTAMSYIVFKTGGRVDGFNHNFTKTCLYEMGQSAPGDGFAISSPGIAREFGGGTSSHVVRYEALYGDPQDVNDSDAVGVGSGATDFILDHVSILGGADEIFRIDVTSNRPEFISLTNMTFGVTSKTTAGWGTNFNTDTLADGSPTGMGPISLARSLFYDCDHRCPTVGSTDTIAADSTGADRFWNENINIMVRNWNLSGKAGDRQPSGPLDEVGNLYRRAFSNNGIPPTRMRLYWIPPDTTTALFYDNDAGIHMSDVHCQDEAEPGSSQCDNATDYETMYLVHSGEIIPDSMRRATRHSKFTGLPWPIVPLAALDLPEILLDSARNGSLNADVGSYRGINSDGSAWVGGTSRRPAPDSGAVEQWFNGGGIQESDSDVSWADYGGVPTHAAGTAWTDADADNFPDDYETACSVTDPTADDDGDGVPNIQDLFDGHDLEGINVTFSPGETIDSIQVEKDVGSGFALDTTLIWPDTVLTVRRFQRDTIYRGKKFIGGALDATTAPDTAKCY